MKRALLITAAGTSTRFRATAGRDVLKCLYHEGSPADSLLHYHARLARAGGFDHVCFVGGYRFADLAAALAGPDCQGFLAGLDLTCLENPDFEAKGCGYSLYLGLRALLERPDIGEIVFMEGDLAVDYATLARVIAAEGDALTASPEPLTARRSVCVYQTLEGEMRFLYDPEHRRLQIPEPFLAVHNSGQVWKFADREALDRVVQGLTAEERAGTNLVVVQKYFQGRPNPEVRTFARWHNCNTLEDYRAARTLLREAVG